MIGFGFAAPSFKVTGGVANAAVAATPTSASASASAARNRLIQNTPFGKVDASEGIGRDENGHSLATPFRQATTPEYARRQR